MDLLWIGSSLSLFSSIKMKNIEFYIKILNTNLSYSQLKISELLNIRDNFSAIHHFKNKNQEIPVKIFHIFLEK